MKNEWLETVLDATSSTPEARIEDEGPLLELPEDVSHANLRKGSEIFGLDGVVIGKLVDFKDSGEPLVDFPANMTGKHLPARSTVALGKNAIGREVALLFEESDPRKPIVMGLIQQPESTIASVETPALEEQPQPINVEIDGERLVFTAQKEIVLRCGKASITLTRAGKVLIRGAYVLSRSSGANKIKGGSIALN